jgi:hypothetical protein
VVVVSATVVDVVAGVDVVVVEATVVVVATGVTVVVVSSAESPPLQAAPTNTNVARREPNRLRLVIVRPLRTSGQTLQAAILHNRS